MRFQSSIVLPVAKTRVFARQISLRDYIEFLKCLQNNEPVVIERFIRYLIEQYCDVTHLTIIDQLVLMVFLRVISINSALVYEDKGQKVNIELYPFLNSLLEVDVKSTTTLEGAVALTVPTCLFSEDKYALYQSCTNTPINDLPAKFCKECQEYIDFIDQKIKIEFRYHAQQPPVPVRVSDNSIFEIIQVLYTDSLQNIFHKIYTLVSSAHFSEDYLLSIPPAELEVMLSILKADTEVKPKRPGVDIPPPPVNTNGFYE